MSAFGMGSSSAYGNNPMGGLARVTTAARAGLPARTGARPAGQKAGLLTGGLRPPVAVNDTGMHQALAAHRRPVTYPSMGGLSVDPQIGLAVQRAAAQGINPAAAGLPARPGPIQGGPQEANRPVDALLAQLGITTPQQQMMFRRWVQAQAGR